MSIVLAGAESANHYAITQPPGAVGHYTDGGSRIRLGSWFYSFGGLNDGWACAGGRVWVPHVDLIGKTVRISAFLRTTGDSPAVEKINLNDTPLRSADVVATATGWAQVTWEPFPFADGQPIFIMYEWLDAPGVYGFENGNDFGDDAVQSELAGLYFAEKPFPRSGFVIGNEAFAADSMNWYGSDAIIATSVTADPPGAGAGLFGWDAAVTVSGQRPSRGAVAPSALWSVGVAATAPHRGGITIGHAWETAAGGLTPDVSAADGGAQLDWAAGISVAPRTRHRGGITVSTRWGLAAGGTVPRQPGIRIRARMGDKIPRARLLPRRNRSRLEG